MFKKLLLLLAFWGACLCAMAAVEVNQASVAELDSIHGIGPALSQRILDARKSGAFKDWADFEQRVQGIGPKNAAKFSADGLTVNGASRPGNMPAAPKAAPRAAAQAAAPQAAAAPPAAAQDAGMGGMGAASATAPAPEAKARKAKKAASAAG